MAKLNLRKELEARILDLTDVEARKSRFSPQLAIYRGKREIAHFHSNSEIDIRITKKNARVLKPDYRVENSKPVRDWVVAHFEEVADLDYVFRLVEMAWKSNKV